MCPSCGGLATECQAPENDGRYAADDPIRCHRTTALLEIQDRHSKSEVRHGEALMWEQPQLRD